MTSSDKQRRLWDWYFGSSPATPEIPPESVFAGNYPGNAQLYSDGAPSITLATPFARTPDAPAMECVGMRLWLPQTLAGQTDKVKIMAWFNADIAIDPLNSTDIDIMVPVVGWLVALFDTPILMPGTITDPFYLGYRFNSYQADSDDFYVHTGAMRADDNAIIGADGNVQIPSVASRFANGGPATPANTKMVGYGIDILARPVVDDI